MAIPEVCSLWIEQRVAEESESEKSGREIGRIIAAQVEKYFEVKISPEAIRSRAKRTVGQNDPPEENNEESTINTNLEKLEKTHGGAREGSGRKKREKSQKAHWKTVERNLDSLHKYMMENCRLKEENITKTTAIRIINHIRGLTVIQEHFLDGVADAGQDQ